MRLWRSFKGRHKITWTSSLCVYAHILTERIRRSFSTWKSSWHYLKNDVIVKQFSLEYSTFLPKWHVSTYSCHISSIVYSLYMPGSFLHRETVAGISRQPTGAESPPCCGFGLVLRGLRAMKLAVAAMWTHPMMGWLQRGWVLRNPCQSHNSSVVIPSWYVKNGLSKYICYSSSMC